MSFVCGKCGDDMTLEETVSHPVKCRYEIEKARIQNKREISNQELSDYFMERIENQAKIIKKLRLRLTQSREGFALMAEGEGSNPQVYKDMALYWMQKCDEVLNDTKG